MSIRFRCKKCNQKYELDDDFAGDTLECGKCDTPMLVPQESEIPPKATAPTDDKPVTPDYQPDSASASATSEDNVIVWCKACGQKYNLSKDLAGREGECAKCKKVFKVPAETEAKLSGMMSLLKQELLEKRNAPAKKTSAPEDARVAAASEPAVQEEPAACPEQTAEPASEPQKNKITLKHLLGMPKHTLLFGGFALIIDTLMQHGLLRKTPRKIVIFLFLLISLLITMLIVFSGIKIYQQMNVKEELQIKVIPVKQSQIKASSTRNADPSVKAP